jgi:GNAT superfamily N-acetyltransferase
MNRPAWTVSPPGPSDRDGWEQLYRSYAAFYEVPMTEDGAATTWGWLLDPEHPSRGLLVREPGGRPRGLAHYRPYPRLLEADTACYLDDLFVDSAFRGSGAVDALFDAVRDVARLRGWSVVNWITADDNHRARGVYDRIAERTTWVTYEMRVERATPTVE